MDLWLEHFATIDWLTNCVLKIVTTNFIDSRGKKLNFPVSDDVLEYPGRCVYDNKVPIEFPDLSHICKHLSPIATTVGRHRHHGPAVRC